MTTIFWLLTAITVPSSLSAAQGALTNGADHAGSIAAGGHDSWTLTAEPGDRVVVQVGKVSGGATFTPAIEVVSPEGMGLGFTSDSLAARLNIQAHVSGTYTVLISDLHGTGSGDYLLRLAQLPGTFMVPTNDEGGALENGQNHDGGIVAGDLDLWTVAANQGDRMVVQIAETSGGAAFTPMFELFAPDGRRMQIKSDGVAARLDAQAATTGTYTVLVSDANRSGTGTYRLRLAQVPTTFTVPTTDDGGSLVNGTNQPGTIELGDLDLWRFTANQGDRITVQIGEVTGGPGSTPQLELFGPDGSRRAVDFGGSAARLDLQAPANGTYTVLVSDASPGGSGSYELHLAQVPGEFNVPTGDEGGAMVENQNYDGAIHLGDLDLWSFSAALGNKISVQVTEISGGANFTPKIELFGPGGQPEAMQQGASGATLDIAVEMAGTYTVLVSDATGEGAGTYQLRLTSSTIAAPGLNVLTNGGTFLGTISPAGHEDQWTFTASAGDTIVVRAGETTANGPLTPRLRLYGPDGAQLAENSNNYRVAAEVSARATNSGIFMVSVQDGGIGETGTGSYRISLCKTGAPLAISASDEGGALTNGATYLGTIEVGDIDAWTFTANAGENLIVRMGEIGSGAPSPLTPQLRLYGPDGTKLAENANNYVVASEVSARATNSGTFMVVAGDANIGWTGAGNYRLSLAKTGSALAISASDEGGPLTNGVTYLATTDLGDLDAWTFTANAGENLIVRMGEINPGTPVSLTPELRLYGPDGVLLDENANNYVVASEVSARATNSGTFMVVAGDRSIGWTGLGNYRLSLAKTGSPLAISASDEGGPLTNGGTQVATVEVGDMDAWTFTANAGQNIIVRMGEISTGTPVSLTPELRLYGPDGVLLDENVNNYVVAAEVSARATNSGTFMVVAGDRSFGWTGAGNYRLSLAKTGNPLAISASDEGGTLTNGWAHLAAVETGDIDAWAFKANAGEHIIVRMGEIKAATPSPLTPHLRLYGPDGVLLDQNSNNYQVAAEVSVQATNSGTFILVAGDGNVGWTGTGNYRLTLALTSRGYAVSPGDDGGPLPQEGAPAGEITVGDADVWSFAADAGDSITLRINKVIDNGGFRPWIRLYAPSGVLVAERSGATQAEISFQAAESCFFMLVVSDGAIGYVGAGTYELTAIGLPAQDKQLRIELLAPHLVRVCWPPELFGYVLQQKNDLGNPDWTDVRADVFDNGLNASVVLPAEGEQAFFQLRSLSP